MFSNRLFYVRRSLLVIVLALTLTACDLFNSNNNTDGNASNDRLLLYVDDPQALLVAVFVRLFGLDPLNPEIVDLTDLLQLGNNVIGDADTSDAVRAELFFACNRGMINSFQQYDFYKVNFDLSENQSTEFKVLCRPQDSSKQSISLNVDLSNEYYYGNFYTGNQRTTPAKGLSGGFVEMFNYDLYKADKYNGFIIATNMSSRFEAYAFEYNDSDTIVADSTKLKPMEDSTIDDSKHHQLSDYLGVSIYGKANGLLQPYYSLDNGTFNTDRRVPTMDFTGIGGVTKISADYQQTNSSTGEVDRVNFRRYYAMAPMTVEFTDDKPAYIDPVNDVTATDDTNGFTVQYTYSVGGGLFAQYKSSVSAETEDSGNSIRYKWRATDYTLSGKIEATWPDEFLNSSGVSSTGVTGHIPQYDLNRTKLGFNAAYDAESARAYDMNPDKSDLLDNAYTVSITHNF